VEAMPHGKHSARRHGRDHASARPPRGPRAATWPARLIWVAVVGVVSVLLAATLAVRSMGQYGVLTASSKAAGPLFGASASDRRWLARSTAEFGHLPIIRTSYTGLPAANVWTTGADGFNHSAVVVSFNARPGRVLSGEDDAALSHFFDTAPTGHAIYYSYYHEPEAHVLAHQFTVARYKAAWAHIVTLAKKAHNPELKSTLILAARDLNPHSGLNWKDYLPGGRLTSTLAWDAYPAGTLSNDDPQLMPPSQFMGPAVAASKSVGLPFGFAAFALGTANGRARWLKEVANYLMSSGALFGLLFNSPRHPPTELTDHASIAAWRSVVARSGTDDPLPLGPTPNPTTPTTTSPTPTPTTTAPTPTDTSVSPSPSPTDTSPSPSPSPTGPACVTSAPSGSCGPYTYPQITGSDGQNTSVGQDVWNRIPGWSQTLHATDPGNWYVTANMPAGNTAVVSFPNTGQNIDWVNGAPPPLSSYTSIYSSFAENMHGTSGTSAEAAYDIWLNNWGNEVMIQHDIVNRGTCPVLATAAFGGSGGVPVQDWNLCKYGSELIWQLSGSGEQSGSVDILAMLTWLVSHGYLPQGSGLTAISYGFEICSTGGQPETFQVSRFSISAA
jgi:hypothetical protein